jgi:hypothetical protein
MWDRREKNACKYASIGGENQGQGRLGATNLHFCRLFCEIRAVAAESLQFVRFVPHGAESGSHYAQ